MAIHLLVEQTEGWAMKPCPECGVKFKPGNNPNGLQYHACDRRLGEVRPPPEEMAPKTFVRQVLALTYAAMRDGVNDMELDLAGRAQLIQAASAAHERFGGEDDETEKELERFLGKIEGPGVEVEDEGDLGGALEEADPGDGEHLDEDDEPRGPVLPAAGGRARPRLHVVDRRGASRRGSEGSPGEDGGG